jgi:hypothetical protein
LQQPAATAADGATSGWEEVNRRWRIAVAAGTMGIAGVAAVLALRSKL